MKNNKKINVTKTYLPSLTKYTDYLKKIWKNGHLTNHGPLVFELENKLKNYFNAKHVFFVTNGTVALQIAIKALELKDEVITTPFSFVATTSSLVWENCKPVFADIDPMTLTINPDEIENKITKKTTGILATHVYGNPCHIEKIKKIAKSHNLKIIYDAAHAFGVKYKGKSVMNFGDISTVSFHATKIFHTIEGGAIVTNDDKIASKINYMRNFGLKDPKTFEGLGINGKNCEFHSAMGLCILPKISKIIKARKSCSDIYDKLLKDLDVQRPIFRDSIDKNYSFYPIILPTENKLLKVVKGLEEVNIFPRRYFYPSLNKLSYAGDQINPISEDISTRVLCLPLFSDLAKQDILKITEIIKENIK